MGTIRSPHEQSWTVTAKGPMLVGATSSGRSQRVIDNSKNTAKAQGLLL